MRAIEMRIVLNRVSKRIFFSKSTRAAKNRQLSRFSQLWMAIKGTPFSTSVYSIFFPSSKDKEEEALMHNRKQKKGRKSFLKEGIYAPDSFKKYYICKVRFLARWSVLEMRIRRGFWEISEKIYFNWSFCVIHDYLKKIRN